MKKTLSKKRVTWGPTVVNNNTPSTHKSNPKEKFRIPHANKYSAQIEKDLIVEGAPKEDRSKELDVFLKTVTYSLLMMKTSLHNY